MATIDSASHWSDGGGGCRNQRAPRIGEIQRHKAVEMDRTTASTSTNSSNNSSTNKSPPPTQTTATTASSTFLPHASSNNNQNGSSFPNNNTTTTNCNKTELWDMNATATESDQLKDEDVTHESIIESQQNAVDSSSSGNTLPRKFEKLQLTSTVSSVTKTVDTKSTEDDTEKVSKKSEDLADDRCEDIDGDVDDDDDLSVGERRQIPVMSLRRDILQHRTNEDRINTRRRIMLQTQSQSDIPTPTQQQHHPQKGTIPKIQSLESRPIYPNVPYSPYGSPYGSPRSNRRRPLRESRRISIEQSGSFLQLNQYKLMDQIGQGSYGLVKLAYSEEDSIHYAMKILSKRKLLRKAGLMGRGPKKTTSPLDRVYREIAVLKKLDHPNVVKLVEVLDDPLEDSLYLVFELVQQGEVLTIPTDRPLSEERAWCVFRDALQGLEYLHYQRIIHADIKPGNLLLGECGRVKIADLGVCNEFLGEDAAMNNGSTAGTPAFRAPETLIPGQHLYSGKAADIWALGATLYTLVYGNVPFLASSVPAVYEKIKNDQLHYPEYPAISTDLRDLIEKLLTKDPAKRITLPQIKEHPWVTGNGQFPLPSEEENCRLVQISEEDINSVVKSIPKLDTLILIKTMLKNHSFQNPFSRGGISGRAPQRGGSRLERFTRAGRSNSAPGAYHLSESRQLSSDNILPAVSESVTSSCTESSDQSFDG